MPPAVPPELAGRTVADAMLRHPDLSPPDATAADLVRFFAEHDHRHAALVVEGRRLLAVVEEPDLVGVDPASPAAALGDRAGRTVEPQVDLGEAWAAMVSTGRRRLAVVDGDTLVGLLCLKRSGQGFCSPADVAARTADHR